jgi:transposase
MMKVKQKIPGSFRSLQSAEDFWVLRGFISTARKQNRNILAALATVCA